ncbi:hypothetical protein [Mycobacteroides abscessus]|uniref:hypothetical protein n=1 Tax=Mycobacteroides abscessus TaxID=36809 RepID=UPI0009A8FA7E|nr:hypothetical protein [Mycobacteroides abscessus]SLC41712.1 Uncharacterised protein [Mycobacteroides abscessus subsp. abscessus]
MTDTDTPTLEGLYRLNRREFLQRNPDIPYLAAELFHAHKFLADPDEESGVLAIWNGSAYALPTYRDGAYFRSKYAASREGLSTLLHHNMGASIYGGALDALIAELLSLCREHGRVWTSGAGSGLYRNAPHAVLSNGLVDTTTGTLRPHDPDFFVAGQFPVNYTHDVPVEYAQWVERRGLVSQLDKLEAWSATIFDSTFTAPRIMTLTGDTYEAGKSTWVDLMSAMVCDDALNDVRNPCHMYFGRDSLRTDKWRSKGLPTYERIRLQFAVTLSAQNVSIKDIRSARIRNFALALPTSALLVAEIVGEGWNTDAYREWKRKGYSPDLEIFKFDCQVSHAQRDIRSKVIPGERDAIASQWIRTLVREGRPS